MNLDRITFERLTIKFAISLFSLYPAFNSVELKMLTLGDPLDVYKAFRGKEPGIDALLINSGLKVQP